jgi:hypothetical protein
MKKSRKKVSDRFLRDGSKINNEQYRAYEMRVKPLGIVREPVLEALN